MAKARNYDYSSSFTITTFRIHLEKGQAVGEGQITSFRLNIRSCPLECFQRQRQERPDMFLIFLF